MKNREIPKGLRDLLPDEVRARRIMEKRAAELFSSYGYEEVMPPTFEYLEVVETGGVNIREKLFLFMDREGDILSLRPEMTVSIARMAATHMQDGIFPRRLFYSGNVFRHVQPHLAQYREFGQLGIEMLGASGSYADAEVISLAVKALQNFGLTSFKVSLNQIAIFNSLLDDSSIEHSEKNTIRKLVENKDLVELSRCLERLDINDRLKETIASLPVLHGDMDILKKIPYVESNRNAATAVEELCKVYDALKTIGVQENIVIDMGVLRGLDYYTGMVFEGYSPELGYGLLGGGRYDNLLSQFGFPCPATGFALGLDRLALLLKNKEREPRFMLGGKKLDRLVEKSEELRQEGKIVEIDVEMHSRQFLEERIKGRSDYTLIYLDDE